MIDSNTIKKVAKLAKLEIEEKDYDKFSKQLSEIIKHAEMINELNLDDIEPTAHAVEVQNVFREDLPRKTEIINKVLEQAPEHDDERFFKVPKVL